MIKRSLTLNGHKTSLALEAEFWHALEEIAIARNQSLPALISHVDRKRQSANLSSALRLFVLHYYRSPGKMADPGRP